MSKQIKINTKTLKKEIIRLWQSTQHLSLNTFRQGRKKRNKKRFCKKTTKKQKIHLSVNSVYIYSETCGKQYLVSAEFKALTLVWRNNDGREISESTSSLRLVNGQVAKCNNCYLTVS